VEYLFKCACLSHFCIQHEKQESMKEVLGFLEVLKYKWEGLAELYGNGEFTSYVSALKIDRTVSTQSD
jgi:hypothetical protein